MQQLIDIGKNACNLSPRSRIGNNIVDYFTFVQRLETKGKYNTSFYEFVENFDTFKQKKYIQTMLTYYQDVKNKNGTKSHYKVLKEIYNICISAINIMRPLNCMEIYTKYKSKRVLNFCAGWGGSTVAAAALNLDAFYGVEINTELIPAYDNMVSFLKSYAKTEFHHIFQDALTVDYSGLIYDTVFTSPPYYFLEKYQHNVGYKSKAEMDELFYKPIFSITYQHLQPGGYYIINVCKEVFDKILLPLFGPPIEVFSLKKSQRQNNYNEMVYVWLRGPGPLMIPLEC
jgi:16S rRNA G966 N2-methylase RsmD